MMEFYIPDGFARFASQVERRFAVLLQKRVLTGIDVLQLRKWLNNFESDEECYLAAHLLDSLVLRTDKMLASSSEHVLQMLLPNALMRCNRFKVGDLAEFISRMTSGKTEIGIRFVAVDGTFEKTPGKSGAALIRLFSRATDVRGDLLVRPDNLNQLGSGVKALVFLDDCLGSGTQFARFCTYYKLRQLVPARTLIYIPYVAHRDGVSNLKKTFPELQVWPVEILGDNADFFAGMASEPQIWHRDKCNKVEAVRKFYKQVLEKHNVNPKESEFSLGLSLCFGISTPNNTLKAFHTQEGTWARLFVR